MKTRKIIYLILGVLLIVINVLVTLISANELKKHFTSDEFDIGYLLGSQVFLYIGVWLIFRAYKVQQKNK
jgi:hypothetical protein